MSFHPARALSLRPAGFLLAALLSVAAYGQELVAVPPLTAHVSDLSNTLTRDQLTQLDKKLVDFETRKGTQLAVLIVPTTRPEAIEQYSLRVVEQWKLGRKRADDGALLLVAKNDREMRIEVGYGLEGVLPDARAKRIIEDVVAPQFRAGNFYGGVDAGVDAMIKLIDGEPLPPPEKHWRTADRVSNFGPLLMVGFILVVGVGRVLRAMIGRLPAAAVIGAGAGVIAWLVVSSLIAAAAAGFIAFLFTLFGGAPSFGGPRSGGWGGGGLGGGGFGGGGWGGGGGGGFSGGGGGFGGGGASGRW